MVKLICKICETEHEVSKNIETIDSCPYCKTQKIIDGTAKTSEYYKLNPDKLTILTKK